jgi:hypothetical protein
VLVVAALSVLALTASSAQATDGELLRTISAANPQGCGINIGVAFDGTNLLVSCTGNNVIDVVKSSDGSLVREITATSESSIGAIAFDATRGKLWACSPAFGGPGIVLIDPGTGASSNGFTPTSGGCADGLAYDASDDTLWHSADASCEVGHSKTDGTPLGTFNVCAPSLLGGSGNSGIAVGGEKLYMSNDGGQQIYRVDKKVETSTLFATLGQRLEDMECDNITFAPKTALWVIDAYDRTLNAFEIPAGSCNFGGQTASVTLTPATAENVVGTNHTVTATVTEENVALKGVTVTFTVTGANPQTGTGTTNASGEATFTYKGENAGTDSIVASFEDKNKKTQTSNTATKTWTKPGGQEPTTTTTSLSGGGQSGLSITVNEGTAVTDQATVTGTNAGSATGTVSYKVYSDNKCKVEAEDAGTVTVSEGKVPASEAKTLKPEGKYYWQATYSGDGSLNEGSKSECGSEVETVGPPLPPPCTKVVGSAKVAIRKEGETEQQKVENNLSTNLASKQKLIFKWHNGTSKLVLTKLTSASCVVKTLKKKFTGQGAVTVNGEPGWTAKFYFIITTKQAFTFHIRVSKPKEEPFGFTDKAARLTSETIS